MSNFQDYGELENTGVSYGGGEAVDPKDEFFHSLYISGKTRTNDDGVVEKPDMLQIRGVSNNHDHVYMIITHVKQVLVNTLRVDNKDKLVCFSYCEGTKPYTGISGHQCGATSQDRSTDSFCASCRSQLIVAGILTDQTGSAILDNQNKPIFIFIRGKGMKYSNVSIYLNTCFQREWPPMFVPSTPESLQFEKNVVSNKRTVTIIQVGFADSKFGQKSVFELSQGEPIPIKTIEEILKISKKTLEQFNNKMNWSLKKNTSVQGYVSESPRPMDETKPATKSPEPAQNQTTSTMSFDSLIF